MIIDTLSREESETVLLANHTASLACVHDDRPYVVPISYAFAGSYIYSFSLEGQKINWMRDNKFVSLLVVEHGSGIKWKSVVVSGTFEEFNAHTYFDNDNDFAWKALKKRANWWEPGSIKPVGEPKPAPTSIIYYCIGIDEISGRCSRDVSQGEQ